MEGEERTLTGLGVGIKVDVDVFLPAALFPAQLTTIGSVSYIYIVFV